MLFRRLRQRDLLACDVRRDDGGAIEEFIRDLTPLPLESRAALLSSVLKPEIEIY